MKVKCKIKREDLEKALSTYPNCRTPSQATSWYLPDTIEVDAEVDISVMKKKNEEAK